MKYALVLAGCSDLAGEAGRLAGFQKQLGGQAELVVFTNQADIPGLLPCQTIQYVSKEFAPEFCCGEQVLPVLQELQWEKEYDLFLFGGSLGGELAVRLGCRLGWPAMTNIETIENKEGALSMTRSAYSGNVKARFAFETPACLGVSPLALIEELPAWEGEICHRERNPAPAAFRKNISVTWTGEKETLEKAKRVVVAGRGVRGKDGIALAKKLAKLLGASLGGTRALVADGMLPLDTVVGSSGKILHPECCIALGVSGAMPLMAGIEKSKMVVSINNDPCAPIFKGSDVGILADWEPAARELIGLLEKKNGKSI